MQKHPKPRLEMTPRGRVTLLLIHLTGSAAWLTQDHVAQLATAALAAPFLVDWACKLLLAPRVKLGLRARRTRAGDTFVERVEVRNLRSFAAAHALEVHEPATETRRGRAFVESIPARTPALIEIPTRVKRRGITRARRYELMSAYPFGMIRWRWTADCETYLVAEPARAPLDPDVLQRLTVVQEQESQLVGATTGGEFFSLREYQPDEDARRVHAKKSASYGSLVIREMRGGQDPDLLVVIDLRRPPGRGFHFADRRIEQRISVAATLIDEMLARRIAPTCVLIGADLQQWTLRSDTDVEDFFDNLATARAVNYRKIAGEVFRQLDAHARTAFWVAAAGHEARSERSHLHDVVVVEEYES